MKFILQGAAVSLIVIAIVGCGAANLEAENQRLADELSDVRGEYDRTLAEQRELEGQNEEMMRRLREAGQSFETMADARRALEARLAEMRQREEQQRSRLESMRSMMTQFRDMIAAGQLRVRIVRGKMVVELPEGVLFDSGRAEIKDEGQATLQQVAQVLASLDRSFLVSGHTDNIPIRSRRFPSNWDLSAARGVVVARFLAESGVPVERLAAAGYADTQPTASNDTDEGRAQNRRIEIVLMPNLDELPDLSQLEREIEQTEAAGASGAEPAAAGTGAAEGESAAAE